MLPSEQMDFKARVVSHCKWIATFDREYAVSTFNYYAELMPWLELRKK